MSKDIWLPILVGIVILGGLGYLVVKVSDIDGTLRSVETKVTNTDQRIDRIAQALPDMNIRIATEEVEKRIQTAIISTKPFQDSQGQWMINVHLLDLTKSEQSTYMVALANQSDRKSIYTLMGFGVDAEPSAPTFRDLSVWSSEIKSPKPVPSFIDSNFSLAFRATKADDLKYKFHWIGSEIDKKPLTVKIYSWVDLANNLKEKPEQFQPRE